MVSYRRNHQKLLEILKLNSGLFVVIYHKLLIKLPKIFKKFITELFGNFSTQKSKSDMGANDVRINKNV